MFYTLLQAIDIKAQGEPMVGANEDTSDMAPRVLDTDRYPQEARITSVLWGKRKAGGRLKGVSFASQDKGPKGTGKNRYSFAAADYYSQNSDNEAMWHMKWLSRLVRFQLNNGDISQQGQDAPQDIQTNNSEGQKMMEKAMGSVSDKLGVDVDDYLLH